MTQVEEKQLFLKRNVPELKLEIPTSWPAQGQIKVGPISTSCLSRNCQPLQNINRLSQTIATGIILHSMNRHVYNTFAHPEQITGTDFELIVPAQWSSSTE
jgi:hypothetical protein